MKNKQNIFALLMVFLLPLFVKSQNYTPDRQQNLNVVYFIPSDMEAVPGHEARISKVMLWAQGWYAENMQQNGYGYKSFGLLKYINGNDATVKITTIYGSKNRDAYMASLNNIDIWTEINQHFQNTPNDKTSNRTLIILPRLSYNSVAKTSEPGTAAFATTFGTDYVAFANDYEDMDPDNFELWTDNGSPKKIHVTRRIGGLIHELGHCLGLPHCGQKVSELSNVNQGTSLMGGSNATIGRTPTFITASDCAVLNFCPIFNDGDIMKDENVNSEITNINFRYDAETASFVIYGTYQSDAEVSKIIFYNDASDGGEQWLQNNDYDAITWITSPSSPGTFSVSIPINEFPISTRSNGQAYELRIRFLHNNNGRLGRAIKYYYFYNNGIPVFNSLVGGVTYPINGTENAPASFATIKSALMYLNKYSASGSGQVVFELTDTYNPAAEFNGVNTNVPITIGALPGLSTDLGLTIRPASGVTTEITAAINNSSIIILNGANYVTIDGRQGGAGVIGLTINNTDNTEGYAVRFNGTTSNNTIKYCALKANNTVSGNLPGVVYANSAAGTSNTIANNNISGGIAGISIYTGSSYPWTGLKVENNNISGFSTRGIYYNSSSTSELNPTFLGNNIYAPTGTAATTGIYIGFGGRGLLTIKDNYIGGTAAQVGGTPLISNASFSAIQVSSGAVITTADITGNTIANVNITSAAGLYINGLNFSASSSTSGTFNVLGNKVYNFKYTGTTTTGGIRGIVTDGNTTTYNLVNNVISLVGANAGTEPVYGILRPAASTVNAYFNSIHLSPKAIENTNNAYGFYTTTAGAITVKSNIISNTYTNGSYKGNSSNATFTENNNLFIYPGGGVIGGTNGNVFYGYGTDTFGPQTFTDFFQDAANGQLYVKQANDNLFYHVGTPIVGYTTDILGVTRHETTPSIGAYENSAETVLPVTINSFTAKLNNNKVLFNWGVGTENNVNRYEVERLQTNGGYVTVAQVAANGSANYNTTDAQPLLGVNYYRLKSVDNDGTVDYFAMLRDVKVAKLSDKAVIVSPNPVVDNTVTVTLTNYAAGLYSYKLVSIGGNVVQKGQFVNNGSNVIALPTLAKGVYILYATNGTAIIQTKFIKN